MNIYLLSAVVRLLVNALLLRVVASRLFSSIPPPPATPRSQASDRCILFPFPFQSPLLWRSKFIRPSTDPEPSIPSKKTQSPPFHSHPPLCSALLLDQAATRSYQRASCRLQHTQVRGQATPRTQGVRGQAWLPLVT